MLSQTHIESMARKHHAFYYVFDKQMALWYHWGININGRSDTKTMTIRLDDELGYSIRVLAAMQKISMNELIKRILDDYVKNIDIKIPKQEDINKQ